MNPSLSGGQLPPALHRCYVAKLGCLGDWVESMHCSLTSEEGSSGYNIMLHRDSAVLRG